MLIDMDEEGKDKVDYSLLPWPVLEGAARAMQHGAKKYSAFGWLEVAEWRVSYFNALMRHVLTWWGTDEELDQESGLHHLDHALACLMILRARVLLDAETKKGDT